MVIVFLIIACGTLLYQNQVLNPYPITIWLYPGYEVQLLLPIILALTLLGGAMLGFFIAILQILSDKKETMSLRTKVRRLQVELDSLRNHAIDDDIVLNDSMLDESSNYKKEETIIE
tara:strand:- start:919 stop:1269 length:351 start_codon:yes stop_codon:yes gene_type:complete